MRRLLRIAIETPTMSRAVTMIWKVSDLKTRPNWSSRDEAKLDGYSLQQFHKFGLEKVASADRFERFLKDNMSVACSCDDTRVAFTESDNCCFARCTGQDAVEACGASPSLDIAKDGRPALYGQVGIDVVRQFLCMPCAFCHDDNVVFLVCYDVVVQAGDEFGDAEGQFRSQNDVGASRQSSFECNGAIVSAHDLNDKHAVVRLCYIANTVDSINGDVDGSIKPDGVVEAIQVVVDGRGDPDDGNTQLAEQVTPVCEPLPPMMTMPSSWLSWTT